MIIDRPLTLDERRNNVDHIFTNLEGIFQSNSILEINSLANDIYSLVDEISQSKILELGVIAKSPKR